MCAQPQSQHRHRPAATPEEVATLIAILASERAANVTGVNSVIDGGLIKTT
jgi:NAD(P)-dependent dehydrogenase (short-subunit alcohol dehydrogenase family)